MARFRPEEARGNLLLRLVSACVLAPPVFAAVHFGPPWHQILVLAAAAAMVWEWTRLCGARPLQGWILAAGTLAGCAAVLLGMPFAAAAAAAVTAAGVLRLRGGGVSGDSAVFALGALALVLFAVVFLWLRAEPAGRELVLGLLCVVWATDVGAYACGRTFGGPRLAPRVSPGKTWSGLCGGLLCAAACGWLWSRITDIGEPAPAAALAAAFALLAQAGDLSVSAAKRRYGAKDAGGLVPGHGGVLDRADGLLLTGPAAALLAAGGG